LSGYYPATPALTASPESTTYSVLIDYPESTTSPILTSYPVLASSPKYTTSPVLTSSPVAESFSIFPVFPESYYYSNPSAF
jgi:hypothetical protein